LTTLLSPVFQVAVFGLLRVTGAATFHKIRLAVVPCPDREQMVGLQVALLAVLFRQALKRLSRPAAEEATVAISGVYLGRDSVPVLRILGP
jgi:disulfide bond formation protein DsbB